MPTPRVKIPAQAAKGEVFEVKTTIDHDMESGQRKDSAGKPIPRKIINKFVCTYNGKEVFKSDWAAAISANPYLSFFLTATESGPIELKWHDDDGQVYSASHAITVA
ncbi:putative sulfur oxidation protein (SoxZ) [Magnetospirillum sp. LM-5]|uniref:thiosulfate oxidation carrier complex protein SoxZ n=1 Tax=Magnetospirillum sp. LM-5 TaxID=2681466 RepID=UPI001382D4DD|nr:thiosulfate oxidation carrier complex protein SoxZ [Magnetospirillum sp. LM-5]CAA7615610.1 putative sulfur oxidation protein (SoxZ) [Magnetospirillum sp. LM-5]